MRKVLISIGLTLTVAMNAQANICDPSGDGKVGSADLVEWHQLGEESVMTSFISICFAMFGYEQPISFEMYLLASVRSEGVDEGGNRFIRREGPYEVGHHLGPKKTKVELIVTYYEDTDDVREIRRFESLWRFDREYIETYTQDGILIKSCRRRKNKFFPNGEPNFNAQWGECNPYVVKDVKYALKNIINDWWDVENDGELPFESPAEDEE